MGNQLGNFGGSQRLHIGDYWRDGGLRLLSAEVQGQADEPSIAPADSSLPQLPRASRYLCDHGARIQDLPGNRYRNCLGVIAGLSRWLHGRQRMATQRISRLRTYGIR